MCIMEVAQMGCHVSLFTTFLGVEVGKGCFGAWMLAALCRIDKRLAVGTSVS